MVPNINDELLSYPEWYEEELLPFFDYLELDDEAYYDEDCYDYDYNFDDY